MDMLACRSGWLSGKHQYGTHFLVDHSWQGTVLRDKLDLQGIREHLGSVEHYEEKWPGKVLGIGS